MKSTKPSDVGTNRTGIGTSPIDSKKTIEGAVAGGSTVAGDAREIERVRDEYARGAPPVGTAPPPATVTGAVKAVVEALKGEKAAVLIDRLGERLAFERTGARIYEALFVKCRNASPRPEGPTEADLRQIHDEELQHAGILIQAIEQLGADPTAVTPSADIAGVASSGIVKVVTDPRATLAQGLAAVLTAELTDVAGWELLSDLARAMGQAELAKKLLRPLEHERRHLANVKRWVAASALGDAGAKKAAA